METVSELSEIAEVEQAEEIETIDETVEVVTTSLESIAGITDLNNIHWLGDAEGKECYIFGSKLVFSNSSDTDEIGLNTLLLQNGSDWKLEKDSVIVTFVMKNGKLDRIIYEGDGRFNAVYFAPAVEEVTEESEPITEETVEEIVEEAIEETTEETVTEESIVETESDGEESVPESKPEESEGIPKEQTLPVVIEEKSVEITIVCGSIELSGNDAIATSGDPKQMGGDTETESGSIMKNMFTFNPLGNSNNDSKWQ